MVAFSINYLTRRKALAWVAFWKLEKIWRSSSFSIATKIRVFNTTCVTVLSYGWDSWVLSVNIENRINAFATSCYRIMLNTKRLDCVSNARIHEMANTQPLINTVRQRQLRFLGHILRMPDEEPCRRYALYVPISWQKEIRATKDKLHIVHPEAARHELDSGNGKVLCREEKLIPREENEATAIKKETRPSLNRDGGRELSKIYGSLLAIPSS